MTLSMERDAYAKQVSELLIEKGMLFDDERTDVERFLRGW